MQKALVIAVCFLTSGIGCCLGQETSETASNEEYSLTWACDKELQFGDIRFAIRGKVPSDVSNKMITAMSDVREVDVEIEECYTPITENELEWLSKITGINRLHCDAMGVRANFGDAGYTHLSKLEKIYSLAMPVSNLRGISKLKALPELDNLDLRGSKFDAPDDFRELEQLRALRHLRLSNTNIDDRTLGCLQSLRWLRSLDLSSTKMSNEGILYLRSVMKNTNVITDKQERRETETKRQK